MIFWCYSLNIKDYYENDHSNVHRGVHTLSVRATEAYENARVKVAEFLNSPNVHQIIFTKGTTDSINLIASSVTNLVQKDDEILITSMEHHSNIVPWQELCKRTGAVLKVIPINDNGELIIDEYKNMISSRTKLISVVHLALKVSIVFIRRGACGRFHHGLVNQTFQRAQLLSWVPLVRSSEHLGPYLNDHQ